MSSEWARAGACAAIRARDRRAIRLGTIIALVVSVVAVPAILAGCGPKEEYSERLPAGTSSASAPAASAGLQVTVLDTTNTLAIRPGGSAPSFTLDKPATLSVVTTYHFVDGGGPAPGTLAVAGPDDKKYGPWQATGLDGQGGVANAFWEARPDVLLPAGTYTVVDSDPSTWSTNDEASGVGFTTVVVAHQ